MGLHRPQAVTTREPTPREEFLWRLAEWWCRVASAWDVLRGRAVAAYDDDPVPWPKVSAN